MEGHGRELYSDIVQLALGMGTEKWDLEQRTAFQTL